MKCYFVLLISMFFFIHSGFSQTTEKNATDNNNKKFYFPTSLHTDSVALTRAIPQLAREVVAGLTEKEKKEFDKVGALFLIAEDYPKTIETIDSLQGKKNDASESMELKSYARARMSEKQGGKNFEQAFTEDFKAAHAKLSFRKKVNMALLDTTMLKMINTEYTGILEKIKNQKGDSLDLEDARSLVEKFAGESVMKKIFPIMYPLVTTEPYRPVYPAIKSSIWGGVAPVQGINEFPDTKMPYKLLMELTGFASKGMEKEAPKEINGGLSEVARKINLHVAAGIPKKNIDVVVAVHAGAIFAFLKNEEYKRKFKTDNPNIAIIKELQNFGVKFIVCGQAMTFLKTEDENLVPGIKLALTAQTVLSTYQLKGYVYYDIRLD
ncbi:MAG: DsrE family protein [Chitinophagaceae bacterium]|nr:DsrE family protein [Chitinophagaceae bacterium]